MTTLNRRTRDVLCCNANGLIAQTCDPAAATTSSVAATQIIYLAQIGLYAGEVITNIVAPVHVAGAGTAPTTIKLGLYTKALARLGRTGNLNADAKWLSVGRKSFALTAQVTIPADDLYYVAFLEDGVFGTTPMQMLRGTAAIGVVLGATVFPYAITAAGQTDLGDPIAINSGTNGVAWWFGVS